MYGIQLFNRIVLGGEPRILRMHLPPPRDPSVEVEASQITLFFHSMKKSTVNRHVHTHLVQKTNGAPFLAQYNMSPVEGSPAKPEDYPHFMSVYVLIPI